MPLFSIIIPTYNSSETIGRCIDSIRIQSFSDYEIIIIDNESEDKTINILQSYGDIRINIHIGKDKGIYDAMNKGITQASGEWLYFLGSDDYLYENNILKQVSEKILNAKEKIMYGNVQIEGDSGWSNNGEIYDGPFNLEKLLKRNICHQAIFYNHSVFIDMGNYNTAYKICADYDFNLKCYANYRFLYLDIIIAKFTGGNTSFSGIDIEYSKDKWHNIVQYYKLKLYKKSFTQYYAQLKPFVVESNFVRIQMLYQRMRLKIRKKGILND